MKGSENIGQNIYDLADSIFPICRSITGEGVRETLKKLDAYIFAGTGRHLDIKEVPSGTQVFDWTVPKEWRIKSAYIEDEHNNHIIDMKKNNLHVMGYSTPVDEWVSLEELKKHVFTQPDQPGVIPYVTSYYKERFGFCMSAKQLAALANGRYHMYIDSELFDGSLSYAECVIPGEIDQELMITSYICHPSMANNECSGPALLAELIRYVATMEHRKYTYRFVLNPETIGSITYLSRNYRHLKDKLVAGIVLSCVGDDRDYSIVHSRYGNTLADKSLENILRFHSRYTPYSYLKRGSDERQYNAPGIELPVVGFCRSKYGEYPEYHTSADDMSLVSPAGFQGSYEVLTQWVDAMEHNEKYKVSVLCEPQLGKRGLYPTVSQKGSYDAVKAMTNFIAYADGKQDLFEISEIIRTPVVDLLPIVEKLQSEGLIKSKVLQGPYINNDADGALLSYVSCIGEELKNLGIKAGDKLYVSSDISQIIKAAQNDLGFRDKATRNQLLYLLVEKIKDIVTDQGTILFPMYNWDFCRGIRFNYKETKSKVGALNNFVHDNCPEFKRTKHPLYSFMVWGKDQDFLCSLDNQEAFGFNSPFGFLDRNGGKQLALGVSMSAGITYFHYLEQLSEVPYRHHKFFLGKYIDEHGNSEFRSYSQFVRDMNISYEFVMEDSFFIEKGIISCASIHGWRASLVSFSAVRDPIIDNLKHGAVCIYNFGGYDVMKHYDDDRQVYEVGKLSKYRLL